MTNSKPFLVINIITLTVAPCWPIPGCPLSLVSATSRVVAAGRLETPPPAGVVLASPRARAAVRRAALILASSEKVEEVLVTASESFHDQICIILT